MIEIEEHININEHTKSKEPECIYIFDFDDTLINCTGRVSIYQKYSDKPDELIHSLSPLEYYEYVMEPNQYVDYSDFDNQEISDDQSINFNKTIKKIFLEALETFGTDNVYICSARINPEPIRKTLERLIGHSNITIGTIGYTGTEINSTALNARRKSAYIDKLIMIRKPKYVYFYDDNIFNIEAVKNNSEAEKYMHHTKTICVEVNREELIFHNQNSRNHNIPK